MAELEDVALFDMDGTLCDFVRKMMEDLKELQSPGESLSETMLHDDDAPDYLKARMDLIKSSAQWWATLPRFQLGWDVLGITQELDYNTMILTQAPRNNPAASAGKQEWVIRELGPETDVTLTRNKGLVYGKVLVDDYPPYISRWLEHRHNGLVIMPANAANANYIHQNVIRYDGTNLDQVRDAMLVAKNRGVGEPLLL